jgi:hypothetical protein
VRDSSFWHLIANANGLSDPNAMLMPGENLIIPNQVHNAHDNSGTNTVYNPNQIIGEILIALVAIAGLPTRLFRLFQGTHWTLLGFGVGRTSIHARRYLRIHTLGEFGDIVDDAGHIRDAYGIRTGWVLVRPDDYVSAIIHGDGAQALEEHLERVGLGRDHSIAIGGGQRRQ